MSTALYSSGLHVALLFLRFKSRPTTRWLTAGTDKTSPSDGGRGSVRERVDTAMRRFLLVSALWLGLLGAAAPLLACPMHSATSDCCPPGTQAPCNHDSAPVIGSNFASQLCCASAPIGEPLALILTNDTKPSHGASGAADPPPIATLENGSVPLSCVFDHRPRSADSAFSFGATTYLRTGRLRL